MLKSIVEFSLRFRWVVTVIACVTIVYGLYVVTHAKLDVFPDFVPPQATIQTECPGLSPEQVEQLVTLPIENAVNGVTGLDSIRSQSIQGLSIITVVFEEGMDLVVARQRVIESMGRAVERLSSGVGTPRLTPMTSATMDLLKIGLVSDTLSPLELRTFADWTMRPTLLAVRGVAGVHIFVGEVQQLQIQVDAERMAAFGLAFDDILSASSNATGVRGAGFIETDAQHDHPRRIGHRHRGSRR